MVQDDGLVGVRDGDGDPPRVTLYSRRAAEMRVWHASQYEFEDVILAYDDAVLVAPPVRRGGAVRPVVHGLLNRARRAVGLPRTANLQSVSSVSESELFMAVFAAPHEIGALPHLRPAWERASRRVAFIVEMYRPGIPDARDYLRQLRGFDHIFVFTRDVIGPIEELTGVPTSFLATGVDAPLFAPSSPAPERTIDVLSYGRRIPQTHQALVEAWRRGDFYYSFDTVRGRFDVNDHREHRAQLAATLQRARYVIIHRNNDDPGRARRTGGEETLSNRLFEAAASGAMILGSAPRRQTSLAISHGRTPSCRCPTIRPGSRIWFARSTTNPSVAFARAAPARWPRCAIWTGVTGGATSSTRSIFHRGSVC